jgi:hypothetical protein
MTNDERLALRAEKQSERELLKRQILMPRLPSEKQRLVDRLAILEDEILELEGEVEQAVTAA